MYEDQNKRVKKKSRVLDLILLVTSLTLLLIGLIIINRSTKISLISVGAGLLLAYLVTKLINRNFK